MSNKNFGTPTNSSQSDTLQKKYFHSCETYLLVLNNKKNNLLLGKFNVESRFLNFSRINRFISKTFVRED